MTAALTDLRDKSEVVTDKHHSSVEVVYCFGERIYRLHVKVVCRFVKQQKVRSLPRQPRKDHTTALAVRQTPDCTRLTHIIIIIIIVIIVIMFFDEI